LKGYGWEDLLPKCQCQFILDYEDEDSEEDEGRSRKRMKPWRYRWPDDVRDEVLARLLKLNAERAAEENAATAAEISLALPRRPRSRRKDPIGKLPEPML
jgi:hypothetical protein